MNHNGFASQTMILYQLQYTTVINFHAKLYNVSLYNVHPNLHLNKFFSDLAPCARLAQPRAGCASPRTSPLPTLTSARTRPRPASSAGCCPCSSASTASSSLGTCVTSAARPSEPSCGCGTWRTRTSCCCPRTRTRW